MLMTHCSFANESWALRDHGGVRGRLMDWKRVRDIELIRVWFNKKSFLQTLT